MSPVKAAHMLAMANRSAPTVIETRFLALKCNAPPLEVKNYRAGHTTQGIGSHHLKKVAKKSNNGSTI
jgi:hypothetical protein